MTATTMSGHQAMREVQHLSQQRFTMVGLMYAMMIHFLFIIVYLAVNFIQGKDPVQSDGPGIIFLKFPPPINPVNNNPLPKIIGYMNKPTVGIPVPVPEATVSPEKTIATQTEMNGAIGDVNGVTVGNDGGTNNEGTYGVGNIDRIIDEIEPDTFKAVEIQPLPIKQVTPEYPRTARLAGIQGTVWVKCYVDKLGRVKKTMIIKTDSEIFNESALEAAGQFLFKPAIMNAGPVGVWTAIPFRFTLSR